MRLCVAMIASAILLNGCSSCGGGGPVPFGLDGSVRGGGDDDDGTGDDPARPGAEEGRALPEGTRRVDVEGAPIEHTASLRALWAHDVDDDGDRDAVLVAEGDPEAPVRVLFARRDGSRFGTPREVGRSAAAEPGCALAEAELTVHGPWLVARAPVRCEDGAETVEHFVLSTDGTVRLEERIAILPSEHPGAFRLAFGVDDVDQDGRDDLTVEVALTHHDVEDRINLHWLDRPSGLARQSDEPADVLDTRSREALRALRGDPGEALAGSLAVLRLHRALCREPGSARVRIGGSNGIACGESSGAGRAVTTVVRAHAARGEALAALDAYAAMESPGQLINEERRTYARRALSRLPGSDGVSVREGPEVTVPPARGFTLSALGFLDEDHVLVRGTPPQRWTIGGALEPTDPSVGDVRVLDPQKRFAVASLEHRCQAARLQIVQAAAATPASTPTLWGDDEGCTGSWADGGLGWELLGWAPQGIVAARGPELRVLPLDVSARPSGDARALEPGTPPPAPLPAGRSTLDGRFHVELRGPGVLVHHASGDDPPALLWPDGWAEREGALSHPAVSPSGRRVAVVQGGRIIVLERGASD